ncbi:MAG: NAD(P)/FAD-dependent oxidoreductase [Burkholderiales bacterium]|nr:NAD(P)/FAD-dependent oxidoreductase [Burkholderiales bacterium]
MGLTETDSVIVGAGPVGLFQVFQLGLQEIAAHVVDALPCAGGQCVELYGDKPIYDIPGIKVCTGRELVERLLDQLQPFKPQFHFSEVVSSVERQPDGRLLVGTSGGSQFLTKTLFIAAGVGAFLPRKLKVDGIDAYEGRGLFYRIPEGVDVAGKRIVVTGDDDFALETAIQCVPRAASVALLHRRDSFRAGEDTLARMRALQAAGKLQVVIAQPAGFREHGGKLAALQVVDAAAKAHDLPLDLLYALLGISPKLGPVADWGLDLERKQVKVDTESFVTSEPGIFAVGDINTYPGKKKLIACGFHECVLAAFGAAAIVYPDRKHQLQYTTTSPRLHELLGVSPG